MKSSLLVVGSLAFDDLELPSGVFENVVGGAASYTALCASMLANVQIVGVVGEDFDEGFLKELGGRGVDLAGVERIAGGKSFRWRGRYAADLLSRETLDTQLNVFANFAPKLPEAYRDAPFVLLGNIHPALQLDVLKQTRSPKLVATDTMNFWIGGEPKLLGEVLAKTDLLIINDEEARQLSGIDNLLHAARDIRSRGPSRLIIKRGEFGAILFDEDGIFCAPGLLLDRVLDPTGAGDSFAGGLLGYLAKCGDVTSGTLRQALLVATVFGSFCVEEVGPRRLLTVTKAEVARRIAELHRTMDAGREIAL